jgi:hypothetical protein
MLDAAYVFLRDDKKQFLENVKNLRCPMGYVLNLYS